MLTQSQTTVSIMCFERSSLFAGVLGVFLGALPVFLVCPPPLLHYLEAKKEGFDDSGPEIPNSDQVYRPYSARTRPYFHISLPRSSSPGTGLSLDFFSAEKTISISEELNFLLAK